MLPRLIGDQNRIHHIIQLVTEMMLLSDLSHTVSQKACFFLPSGGRNHLIFHASMMVQTMEMLFDL